MQYIRSKMSVWSIEYMKQFWNNSFPFLNYPYLITVVLHFKQSLYILGPDNQHKDGVMSSKFGHQVNSDTHFQTV